MICEQQVEGKEPVVTYKNRRMKEFLNQRPDNNTDSDNEID